MSPKRLIASVAVALTLAACTDPPAHVTIRPKISARKSHLAVEVAWSSAEARTHDEKLWRDAQLWNAVTLWNAVQTLHNAEVAETGCPYAPTIYDTWQADQSWAVKIAMRESHCEPGVENPSGAIGLLQLLGHGDLLAAVCPGHPSPGTDPGCNVAAGWRLYMAAGRSPWNL